MQNLEQRIQAVEERNKIVEANKAWEMSYARRVTVSVFTYVVAVVFLMAIKNENPFLNAFVPVVGFILSTLSLSFIRKVWEK